MTFIIMVGLPFAIWLFGFYNDLPTLWVPLITWIGALVSFPFRHWLISNRLGSNAGLSMALKSTLHILQSLGTLGFWATLVVVVSWFLRGLIL